QFAKKMLASGGSPGAFADPTIVPSSAAHYSPGDLQMKMTSITQRRKGAKISNDSFFASLRLCVRIFSASVVLILVCGFVSTARAELPSIRFDRINPLGAQAGTSVEVEVIGRDVEDVNALRFDHPGLKAELVKPNRFKISVAGDVPEGTYDVRLVGRFGVSNPRLFAVSHELVDVAETEPNNVAAKAQAIAVNSAVQGTSDGNGQDAFRFPAKKGDRITIDCQAQKLESAMDGTLILSSAAGQILATSGDYHGRDPFIDFIAPEDGDYIVVVHDLSYRRGFPYRLVVTNRPQVENVFPPAVQAGKQVELLALGRHR